ncbi:hypothetical protein Leryth_011561 [Lithospermum erythrorhizon]|nr:hypothetical protein Leryth_011561 [Lithospermum erythrorhizon]
MAFIFGPLQVVWMERNHVLITNWININRSSLSEKKLRDHEYDMYSSSMTTNHFAANVTVSAKLPDTSRITEIHLTS